MAFGKVNGMATLAEAYKRAGQAIGLNERDQKTALQEYLANGGVNLDPATQAWCADFVNATLAQSGMKGTGSSAARSFLDWGKPTDTPNKGDIAVFTRGDPSSWTGHVGFFDGYNPDGTIRVLGGNQSDAVTYTNKDPSTLLGFRTAEGSAEAPQEAAPGLLAGIGNMGKEDWQKASQGMAGLLQMAQQPPPMAPPPRPQAQPLPQMQLPDYASQYAAFSSALPWMQATRRV